MYRMDNITRHWEAQFRITFEILPVITKSAHTSEQEQMKVYQRYY